MTPRKFILAGILATFIPTVLWAADVQGPVETPAPVAKLTVEPGHPWTPPFGLERVGRPLEAVVEVPKGANPKDEYVIVGFRDGKEISRRPVVFLDESQFGFMPKQKTPFYRWGRAALSDWPSEVALLHKAPATEPVELARAEVKPPQFEADAAAKPDRVIHPVDLGTLLVPHGWLLLTGGQRATLEVAAVTRSSDLLGGRIVAWYESIPGEKATIAMPLKHGEKKLARLELAAHAGQIKSDKLQVAILDDSGKQLWQKVIPVMVVPEPPKVPRFGAVETKLRYDPPIPTKYPPGKVNYADGWSPDRNDVVIYLPNGARFVFWRGSSYCPFWASRSNTGYSYEWAEIYGKYQIGGKDCVEPLQDKELRYGRVKIIESTPARVHVRWDYQSCDIDYATWGDFASEDFYFYPDSFATRLMTVQQHLGSSLETQEAIYILPQSGYPLEFLSHTLVDLLWPGGKVSFKFPCRIGRDGQDESWEKLFALFRSKTPGPVPPATSIQEKKELWETKLRNTNVCLMHRVHFGKDDPLSAILFTSPRGTGMDVGYLPYCDRGAEVTPMYWGDHWPLSRGYFTAWKISDRIHEAPSGCSSYHAARPEVLENKTGPMINALGETKEMRRRSFYWLIGMTDANDEQLRRWMQSVSHPATVEVTGARKNTRFFVPERRAWCMNAEGRTVSLTIKPEGWCVNPVFELENAPKELKRISLDGKELDSKRYAWDGKTLWLEASLSAPAELRLQF